MLQWARQNGCPWNEIRACPRRGGTWVLQWARQGGCEWDVLFRGDRRGTWRCCSGRVRTGARGTGVLGGAAGRTWRCCSGRVSTGAVGAGRACTRQGRAPGGVAVGASERVPGIEDRRTARAERIRRAPGGFGGSSRAVPVETGNVVTCQKQLPPVPDRARVSGCSCSGTRASPMIAYARRGACSSEHAPALPRLT